MNRSRFLLALMAWSVYAASFNPSVFAQPIVPTTTDTVVSPVDATQQQWLIQGGTQAGGNLFHQFQTFGLDKGQTATFRSNTTVNNIFGRVNGGQPSLINGALQVSGGNSNLFLINPAGVIFGRDARLDLPGAFSATTADALEFGNQGWFNGQAANQYGNLTGDVTGYAWLNPNPGAVVNAGQLAVGAGQSVMLSGGQVINTGTITAPGGQVTIAAVPGERVVRVTQDNQVLSLDLPLVSDADLAELPVPAANQRLPQLLAGREVAEATGLTIENGQVRLSAGKAPITVADGQAIVAGELSVAASLPIAAAPQIDITGERIDLQAANLNASTVQGGGQIRVGGEFQGQGDLPTAQQVNVDASSRLQADATVQGNGGRVIVWSDGTTQFAGEATAKGGAQGGNGGLVETSGQQQLTIDPTAKVTTTAAQGETGEWLLDPADLTVVAAGGTAAVVGGTNSPTAASTIDRATLETALDGTNVQLQATNSITVGTTVDTTANAAGGNLELNAPTLNLNQRITLRTGSNLTGTATTVNVGANGGVQNGVDAAAAGGTVNLAAATYREGQVVTIDKSLTLQGQGAGNTIISGDVDSNGVGDSRGVETRGSGNNITLQQLTIADAMAPDTGGTTDNGGGLQNLGATVQIADAEFRNNRTIDPSGDGGAIHNRSGSIAIVRTQFNNNQAAQDGGAIDIERGSVTVADSFFTQNQAANTGGGIDIDPNGTVSIVNTDFVNNSALNDGGAIFNEGTATIDTASFRSNTATDDGGAITSRFANSQLIITGSSFDSNSAQDNGGGLYLDVPAGGVLSLSQNSFLNNSSGASGGGLFKTNSADLTIANTLFERNTATEHGGGLLVGGGGLSTLTDSNVLQNTAGIDGGGIRLNGSNLAINNSRILTNQAQFGGGLELSLGSTAQVNDSLFQGNTSSSNGGAIQIDDTSTATVTNNSRLLNNQANGQGGAIAVNGSLSLDTVLLQGNTAAGAGGGLFLGGTGGTVSIRSTTVNANTSLGGPGGGLSHQGGQTTTIVDSLFNSNVASGNRNGGALDLFPTVGGTTVQIENTTLSSNRGGNFGGALSQAGTVQTTLNNVTVANNTASTGGGLANVFGASLTVQNTIVAGNTAANDADIAGSITSLGNNLVQNRATSTGYVSADLADGTDPLLLSLANNGGLTLTHAVRANSLAVNGGNASATAADQRGLAAIGQRDIGAYELDNNLTFVVTGSGQTQTVNQTFANPVGVTVTDSLGAVVAGLDIAVTASTTGASAGLGTLQTDSSGVASTTATANTVAGSYTVNLGIASNASIGSVSLTNTPDVPNQIAVLNGNNQSTVVNTAFANPLQFAVTDQFGNPIPFESVGISVPGSGASATAANGFDLNALLFVTDNSGQATVNLDANTIAGSYTVGLTSGSLSNNTTLTNLPDVPDQLVVNNGDNQSSVVNTAFANPLQVTVTDQFGNAVPGATVNVNLPGTGASANAGAIALTTDGLGQATTALTANTVAGNYPVGLTAGSANNSLNLTNLPDAPAQLNLLNGNGQSTLVNTAFAEDLLVQVTDQYGNLLPDVTVTFTAPATGSSTTVTSFSMQTNAAGQGQAAIVANGVAGTYQLLATSGPLTQVVSLENQSEPVEPSPGPGIPPLPTNPPLTNGNPGNTNNQPIISTFPSNAIDVVDADFSADYVRQFGNSVKTQKVTGANIQNLLADLDRQRGIRTAVIYAMFVPDVFTPQTEAVSVANATKIPTLLRAVEPRDDDRLELIFITANGKLQRRSTPYRRREVAEKLSYFWLSNSDVENAESFDQFGQLFQQWLFAPIQTELEAAKINGLMYVLDQGLRSIPLAAMRTPQSSVLEQYTVSAIPSLGMLDRRQTILQNQTILATGASEFDKLVALPAVPAELAMIQQQGFRGTTLLNEQFTLDNVVRQRRQQRPGILHLATHADFNSGAPSNSFIQFWDQKLTLDQIARLDLRDADLELLILSACNTAAGNDTAELGFTGMASLFGVRTALGSLWAVSDLGTFAFMSEFYGQLAATPSRAEALRKTQLAMQQGKVRIEQGALITTGQILDLPLALQAATQDGNFAHPYYWSGFTMVGNPW
ncbi:CHAT domain-containing protein [filamentous cyanobacterium LEGE 11480]|uniref:CHAT domain-containing protein n=1 Tax=Romeriopsis navalis LEGE 11480 TaxID=2777977 RepID=A0A928Z1G1_9CYAN|nr:CHAT domain-containing protein [Romeriopsis navalis]MBE9028474.1 CHAT domain-containing protein [Romeriopsis navalis LEGE 11480]